MRRATNNIKRIEIGRIISNMYLSRNQCLAVTGILLCSTKVLGFTTPSCRSMPKIMSPAASSITSPFRSSSYTSSTSLSMGYNLPPGGGGNDPKDAISSVVTPILGIAATVAFFLSPLGSIFFAITNSVFLLLLLLPLVASIAFTGWQYFYTIEAPCPSCGVPTRVLKDEEAGPNICLNCGSLVRANIDKDGIELCNNPNDIYDENSRISSLFDLFTGGVDSGNTGGAFYEETTTTIETKQDKQRRERTVIEVDVTKDN